MNKLFEALKKIGLSENEALVYLVVLELKELLPSTASKKTGIKRSTTYLLLDRLAKKGLLSAIKKNGHLYYRAKNPQLFTREEIQKSKLVQAALQDLHSDLPKLMDTYNSSDDEVAVSVFKGKHGLKQIETDFKDFKGKLHRYENAENQVTVYGHKVAIVSWKEELGIVIKNKTIALVQKGILGNRGL